MDQKPLCVFLGALFRVEGVFLDLEFGGVDGLAFGVAEEVECKVEEADYIAAFFEVLDVGRFDFEGLQFKMLAPTTTTLWGEGGSIRSSQSGRKSISKLRDTLSAPAAYS